LPNTDSEALTFTGYEDPLDLQRSYYSFNFKPNDQINKFHATGKYDNFGRNDQDDAFDTKITGSGQEIEFTSRKVNKSGATVYKSSGLDVQDFFYSNGISEVSYLMYKSSQSTYNTSIGSWTNSNLYCISREASVQSDGTVTMGENKSCTHRLGEKFSYAFPTQNWTSTNFNANSNKSTTDLFKMMVLVENNDTNMPFLTLMEIMQPVEPYVKKIFYSKHYNVFLGFTGSSTYMHTNQKVEKLLIGYIVNGKQIKGLWQKSDKGEYGAFIARKEMTQPTGTISFVFKKDAASDMERIVVMDGFALKRTEIQPEETIGFEKAGTFKTNAAINLVSSKISKIKFVTANVEKDAYITFRTAGIDFKNRRFVLENGSLYYDTNVRIDLYKLHIGSTWLIDLPYSSGFRHNISEIQNVESNDYEQGKFKFQFTLPNYPDSNGTTVEMKFSSKKAKIVSPAQLNNYDLRFVQN